MGAHVQTINIDPLSDLNGVIIPNVSQPKVLSCPPYWVIILTVKCSGGDNVVKITTHLISCTATNGCEYSLFIAQ